MGYPNGYVTFKNAAVGEIGSTTDFNPNLHHRHQHHQLKAVIQITIKIVFLMDILLTGRLVTRYGYQMALKRIVYLCGEIALVGKNAVGLRIALVILVKRRAFLQLALLLILPLLPLRALKRVNFVKRILIVVKVSAS